MLKVICIRYLQVSEERTLLGQVAGIRREYGIRQEGKELIMECLERQKGSLT